jgi:cytochrome P450
MVAEVDSTLGEGGEPDYATVMQMPYTTAVVKETLRLHPSVPVDLKVVNQDDVLPGQKVHVPKGVSLSVRRRGVALTCIRAW